MKREHLPTFLALVDIECRLLLESALCPGWTAPACNLLIKCVVGSLFPGYFTDSFCNLRCLITHELFLSQLSSIVKRSLSIFW